MLYFRKAFLGMAVLVFRAGLALGQTTPLTCTAQSAGTPSIRAEGVTELVGDLLIQCQGGTPTAANVNLPQVNFQIFTQPAVNITSRQLASDGSTNFSEALLFVDEPSPNNQTLCGSTAYPYSVPVGSGQTLVSGNCGAHAGTGNGIGAYDPNVAAPVIAGVQTSRGNAYQAVQTSNNSLVWRGIPFDPPGDNASRIIRIVNVRVNASQLGVTAGSQGLVRLFVSTSASGLATPIAVPLTNPNPAVATAQRSFGFQVVDAVTCLQSESGNGNFAADNTRPLTARGTKCDGSVNVLRFTEFLPWVFRSRTFALPSGVEAPTPISQDSLGVTYQSESGYVKVAANGNRWPLVAANGSLTAGTSGSLGLADSGTRLTANFTGVQSGVQVWVESTAAITGGTVSTGFARLAITDENGAGAFQAAAAGSSQLGGITRVSINGGGGAAVWEVLQTSTDFAFERLEARVVVAYVSNAQAGLPSPGVSSANGGYAPISTSPTASVAAHLPRFTDSGIDRIWLTITAPVSQPTAPTLVFPSNGATEVSTSATLSWDLPFHAANLIDVYFGIANPPVAIVGNPTANTFKLGALLPLTTYYWKVVVRRGDLSISSTTSSFTTGLVPGLRFVPVAPCRVVDTRQASLGIFGTPKLAGGGTRSFPIRDKAGCNIDANAAAYSINATVVPQVSLGYLTLWPTGQNPPLVSTLNSVDGRIKANAAIVPAGFNGAINVYATDNTELVIDINGYFIDTTIAPAALAFYPLAPCRVMDTRLPNGPLGGPIVAAGTSRAIPFISSNCGLPANAQAYSMNATVVPTGPLGYLTLWPTGEAQPLVSTLNALGGGIVANAAIIKAGVNGSVNAFVTGDTHLVVDVNGYFAPPGAANAQRYFATQPCRVLDSRNPTGEFGGPVLAANGDRSYRLPLAGCGLSASAGAYVLNATVVPAPTLGYLTLWPSGTARPVVSTLNAVDGSITSNMALVPAGANGAVSSFVNNQTQLILDTTGYFAP